MRAHFARLTAGCCLGRSSRGAVRGVGILWLSRVYADVILASPRFQMASDAWILQHPPVCLLVQVRLPNEIASFMEFRLPESHFDNSFWQFIR